VFSTQSSFEPVIANMVLEFKVPLNILYADTKNMNGVAKGEMILQLPDSKELAARMIERLRAKDMTVEEVDDYGMEGYC
jgi:D-methionine transport system ATP-binding protein